jgi:hypothetical protein
MITRPILLAAASLVLQANAQGTRPADIPPDAKAEARWSTPFANAQERQRNQVKEARAALKQNLDECRAAGSGRKACEQDARALYTEELRKATSAPAASPR